MLVVLAWPLPAEDWPQFRGPGGQGHSRESGLPVNWSESAGVRWKTTLPGLGWSSPAIEGHRLWLTTAAEKGYSLRLIGVDTRTGDIVRDVEVFRLDALGSDRGPSSLLLLQPVTSSARIPNQHAPCVPRRSAM